MGGRLDRVRPGHAEDEANLSGSREDDQHGYQSARVGIKKKCGSTET